MLKEVSGIFNYSSLLLPGQLDGATCFNRSYCSVLKQNDIKNESEAKIIYEENKVQSSLNYGFWRY